MHSTIVVTRSSLWLFLHCLWKWANLPSILALSTDRGYDTIRYHCHICHSLYPLRVLRKGVSLYSLGPRELSLNSFVGNSHCNYTLALRPLCTRGSCKKIFDSIWMSVWSGMAFILGILFMNVSASFHCCCDYCCCCACALLMLLSLLLPLSSATRPPPWSPGCMRWYLYSFLLLPLLLPWETRGGRAALLLLLLLAG